MKKILLYSVLIVTAVILSFNLLTPKYKYTIKGTIYIPTSGPNGTHVFTWHCDSVFFKGDTVCYISSDGNVVEITKPYHIIKNY